MSRASTATSPASDSIAAARRQSTAGARARLHRRQSHLARPPCHGTAIAGARPRACARGPAVATAERRLERTARSALPGRRARCRPEYTGWRPCASAVRQLPPIPEISAANIDEGDIRLTTIPSQHRQALRDPLAERRCNRQTRPTFTDTNLARQAAGPDALPARTRPMPRFRPGRTVMYPQQHARKSRAPAPLTSLARPNRYVSRISRDPRQGRRWSYRVSLSCGRARRAAKAVTR